MIIIPLVNWSVMSTANITLSTFSHTRRWSEKPAIIERVRYNITNTDRKSSSPGDICGFALKNLNLYFLISTRLTTADVTVTLSDSGKLQILLNTVG